MGSDKPEGEYTERVVQMTADMLQVAGLVVAERRRREGEEYSSEEPFLQQLVSIAQLIVSASSVGIFNKPETAQSIVQELIPLIDSKIAQALSQQQFHQIESRLAAPAIPQHLWDRVMDRLHIELAKCECMRLGAICADCERNDLAVKVFLEYGKKITEPPATSH